MENIHYITGNLFRDHCWVNANVQSILVDPRITYQFEASITHYGAQKKSLTHILNIKELKMEYEVVRRKHVVVITLSINTPNVTNLSLALPKSTTESLLDKSATTQNNNYVIALSFKQLVKAKQYITNFRSLQSTNELQTILLNNTPDPKQAAGPKAKPQAKSLKPLPVEEYTIQVHLPKTIKVFRQYPLVNNISVEGYGFISKEMAEYQNKKVKATFDGTYYTVAPGIKFIESLVETISEKLMGELITVAVMSPQNFRGIDVDYIKTEIHGNIIRVHQDLITRHGEVFELEKAGNEYFEKSTRLPIPVEILNIQTVRS